MPIISGTEFRVYFLWLVVPRYWFVLYRPTMTYCVHSGDLNLNLEFWIIGNRQTRKGISRRWSEWVIRRGEPLSSCDSVRQLYLSLYLMTQCQMKLHHSVTSLAQTLDYVEVAPRRLQHYTILKRRILDQPLLKLTERKILLYISGQLG